MDAKDLKDQIQKAAEIAKAVPENLQEAAFHRALDLLTGTAHGAPVEAATRTGHTLSPGAVDPPKHPAPEQDLADLLIGQMNATEHPKVRTATTILDRSLTILHGARSSHQIDDLTPSEIARVLTEKFRIATRSGSVSEALGKVSGELVDRVKEGAGYRYRIMEAGERRLDGGNSAAGSKSTARPGPAPRRVTKKKNNEKRGKENKPKEGTSRNKKQQRTGRPGPKQIVGELIDQGFFKQPRIIGEIIQHLKESRGRTYKVTALSPALVRLLRDERLDREKNADGQYEYVVK